MLLVDKPTDWTSFDVVNYVRRMVATEEGVKPKSIKVGHSGTLDPFATGLLVLLIGKQYTRQAEQYSKLDKTYEVTIILGQTSTTGDPEGEISPASDKRPTMEEVQQAVANFVGEISQIPPAYSAIKVDGQRAYKLARAGKAVVIEPRKVIINSLEISDYTYPELKLVADVSSGTYIRTLAEDIGKVLKTGAYAKELRRTKVGSFLVNEAVTKDELTAELIQQSLVEHISG